jgi:hypothetical protein
MNRECNPSVEEDHAGEVGWTSCVGLNHSVTYWPPKWPDAQPAEAGAAAALSFSKPTHLNHLFFHKRQYGHKRLEAPVH